MQYTRFSALLALMLLAGLGQAEGRVEGEVEHGIFVSGYQDLKRASGC
jgi:hypothetical protein